FIGSDKIADLQYCSSYFGSLFYLYHTERNALYYGVFTAGGSGIFLTRIESDQKLTDPRR
ncbi:MAG: hypothetical protein LBU73_02475, partial [Helicobacteraceae bacterium]|nr:hypothetical protein [Helicobacteraceae bacterium]